MKYPLPSLENWFPRLESSMETIDSIENNYNNLMAEASDPASSVERSAYYVIM